MLNQISLTSWFLVGRLMLAVLQPVRFAGYVASANLLMLSIRLSLGVLGAFARASLVPSCSTAVVPSGSEVKLTAEIPC